MENIIKELICQEYTETSIGVESLALKYHVGKLKIKNILNENGIEIKKRGAQKTKEIFLINDWKIEKYKHINNCHYIAIDRNNGYETNDYMNQAGHLTSYIRNEYNIEIPSLYDRRLYYMKTGNYWWEQWFDIKSVEDKKVKKCAYCDWETIDIVNKSGAYEQHLLKVHGITKIEHLEKHPEDKEYFLTSSPQKNRELETNQDNYVVCKICGKKLSKIDYHHLRTHNITKFEYVKKYGNDNITSNTLHKILEKQALNMNLSLDGKNDKFTSKPEIEIRKYIENLGIECKKDRKILNGKELDLFLPEKNIAIEYNGLKWHSEIFGKKDRLYHLNKLQSCNSKNIKLLQIFEDEYVNHKEIVLSKISHIIGTSSIKNRIYARKCIIKTIDNDIAKQFLSKNHIQGFVSSSLYLGCFYNDNIVGVMSFLNEGNNKWNLTRFATDNSYICSGVGGKLFKYFIRNYTYSEIKTFADRRWTLNIDNNLYTKLGFEFVNFVPPTYWYYNSKINKTKRIHKFLLRKKQLMKIGNFSEDMTEWEMARELGYDRIWDCGLIKYVYKNPLL